MAEACLRHFCAAAGLARQVRVASAGTTAWAGGIAQPEVHEVLARHGMELKDFRCTQLAPAVLADCDWVVCMAPAHRQAVLALAPELAGRTLLLTALAGRGDSVPDPYGGTLADYEACLATLRPALHRLVERLRLDCPEQPPT